jgi:protein-S-isoprenylcysteine O-methyltransferase Ste14
VSAFENHDLKAEAPAARAASVRFAFEFPRLLADFREADAIANDSKRASRRAGFASVALVLAALLLASSAPVMHALHVEHRIVSALGFVSAGLGLAGTLLAFLGMHGSAPRRVWLRHRLKTEMMRLFHFHYLAARLPEVACVRGDEARKEGYLARREEAYLRLLDGPLSDPEAELRRIVENDHPYDFQAVSEAALSGGEEPAAVTSAFAAWHALRLEWQLGYAEAMLAAHGTGKRRTARQLEHAFSGLAWACVGAIIGVHLLQIFIGTQFGHSIWTEVAVVWIALTALAARALEDGLQPQRDVERYEQYRANILVARERFDAAGGLRERLEIVRGFERASLEEMRIFMRTHARSRFML